MPAPLDPNRPGIIAAATRDAFDCVLDRTERTNAHRVREAEALMALFHGMTGVNPDPDEDGPDTALGDVLAHLMHWADAKAISFDECLRLGRGHHRDEVIEEAVT